MEAEDVRSSFLATTVHLQDDLDLSERDKDAAQAVSDGLRDAKGRQHPPRLPNRMAPLPRVDSPHRPAINARRAPDSRPLPRPPGRRRQGHRHHRSGPGRDLSRHLRNLTIAEELPYLEREHTSSRPSEQILEVETIKVPKPSS